MLSGATSSPALMAVSDAPIFARRFQNFGVSLRRRLMIVFMLLYDYVPSFLILFSSPFMKKSKVNRYS